MTDKLTWKVSEAVAATNGTLLYGRPQTQFCGVSIDSRTTACGDLFIAIVGQKHDGHRHSIAGMDQGQNGLLINRFIDIELPHEQWRKAGYFCIAVEDTTKALGDLAAYNCKRSQLPVVAITGSTGKTTTRHMSSAVMQQRFTVLSPKGNFNNEIGLPLTLLELCPEHTATVLELGMNHFGEIRRLAKICRPDIGIITNVGPVHLEGVGSVTGVARAKGELMEHLKPGGTMVFNEDDPHLRRLAKDCPHNILNFGFSKTADVCAEEIDFGARKTAFNLRILQTRIGVVINTPGRFMVANALAAAAGGYLMGLSLEQIRTGLANFHSGKGRLHFVTTTMGIKLIDDTYNANPTSMSAALDLLSQVKGPHRGFFVCGDMLELGEQAETLHRELGATAAKSNIQCLFATGQFASAVADGALKNGMSAEKIFTGGKADIIAALATVLQPKDWVLVKGSRAMKMEDISEALKNMGTPTNH